MNSLDPSDPNDDAIATAGYGYLERIRSRYTGETLYALMGLRDEMDGMPLQDKLVAIATRGWLSERLVLGQVIRERRAGFRELSGRLLELAETGAAIPWAEPPKGYKHPEEH